MIVLPVPLFYYEFVMRVVRAYELAAAELEATALNDAAVRSSDVG
jgi:hypothetical protein